jgi:hypothetical protein
MPIKNAFKSSIIMVEEKVPLITCLNVNNLQELVTRYFNASNADQQPRNNGATKALLNFVFGFIAVLNVKWGKEKTNGRYWVCKKLSDFASASQDSIIPFTLLLASNKQFNFNWSYLIDKQEKLWDKLAIFNTFINAVCQDISNIAAHITYGSEWSFIVNEFFIVHYDSNTKSFDVSFDFDNLRNIFDVSKDFYHLMVKYSSGSSVSRITNLDRKITISAANESQTNDKSKISSKSDEFEFKDIKNEIEEWCAFAETIDNHIKIINNHIKSN